jgi:hypothetical protein
VFVRYLANKTDIGAQRRGIGAQRRGIRAQARCLAITTG